MITHNENNCGDTWSIKSLKNGFIVYEAHNGMSHAFVCTSFEEACIRLGHAMGCIPEDESHKVHLEVEVEA